MLLSLSAWPRLDFAYFSTYVCVPESKTVPSASFPFAQMLTATAASPRRPLAKFQVFFPPDLHMVRQLPGPDFAAFLFLARVREYFLKLKIESNYCFPQVRINKISLKYY